MHWPIVNVGDHTTKLNVLTRDRIIVDHVYVSG